MRICSVLLYFTSPRLRSMQRRHVRPFLTPFLSSFCLLLSHSHDEAGHALAEKKKKVRSRYIALRVVRSYNLRTGVKLSGNYTLTISTPSQLHTATGRVSGEEVRHAEECKHAKIH
jgi:hypothetical protein